MIHLTSQYDKYPLGDTVHLRKYMKLKSEICVIMHGNDFSYQHFIYLCFSNNIMLIIVYDDFIFTDYHFIDILASIQVTAIFCKRIRLLFIIKLIITINVVENILSILYLYTETMQHIGLVISRCAMFQFLNPSMFITDKLRLQISAIVRLKY